MSQTRYLKSMITPTLVEPTENHEAGVASGVWSTQDQLEARRGGVWPEAGVPDPDTLIENNFATTLYEGNSSTQSITTGIDSVNKDSLVWIKNRDAADSHVLTDTVKGATKILHSDTTAAEATDADTITAFSSTGFALGDDVKVNTNDESYCAWTFKKAPKFFDIQTYTGDGQDNRTISHNLGAAIGTCIIKRTNASGNWLVWHRSLPDGENLRLQSTDAQGGYKSFYEDAMTSSTFGVRTFSDNTNINTATYVAYLFAHETGSDSMIRCDTYEGNGGTQAIDVGFEPQWLLIKNADGSTDWRIHDVMRGLILGDNAITLRANNAGDEQTNAAISLNANGFSFPNEGSDQVNANNDTYIYIAIRRPNMATITDATEVFTPFLIPVNNAIGTVTPHIVDFGIIGGQTGSDKFYNASRLTGPQRLNSTSVAAGSNQSNQIWDRMNGFWNSAPNGNMSWNWKRAKGFCDVVAYTGTGSARTVAHGLTVAPEMMWVKNRGVADPWAVYYGDNTDYLVLNTDAATVDNANWWNDTSPTSSVFTVGTDHSVNASGEFYIAYLFATLAGISKVGSVTHSGSSTDVDCGFSAGSRFVLLKRTDATGSWYVWDSVRGIIAGNDPYLLFDTTAAEVTNTDLIDPLASGFQISGDFTDGDYIFYAIA